LNPVQVSIQSGHACSQLHKHGGFFMVELVI
jgi:hypothetical protein